MSTRYPPADQAWLTPIEAAKARALNPRLVRRWIESGMLPTSRPGGWFHLVRLADLDALLAASRTPAKTGPLAKAKARKGAKAHG